jgi:putative drug exporter of the RND superfamily
MDAIVSWLPLFLFVVLFGLSMDYHVFVVSRIREAARRGASTRDAVAHGITTSAGTVTSAALVMVAVFSIFATLSRSTRSSSGWVPRRRSCSTRRSSARWCCRH